MKLQKPSSIGTLLFLTGGSVTAFHSPGLNFGLGRSSSLSFPHKSFSLQSTQTKVEEKTDKVLAVDDGLDDEEVQNIVCARGVCALADDDAASELCTFDEESNDFNCVQNENDIVQPGFT